MKQRIILKESEIREAVRRVIRQTLSEARANLPYRIFKSDMKKLGFVCDETPDGSLEKFTIPEHGDCSLVAIHNPHDRDGIQPAALREVVEVLDKNGWFDKPENFGKFQIFSKWGVSIPEIKVDTTQQDIQAANEKYINAAVWRVFPKGNNTLCYLMVGDKYNLCRSENDRRPICKDKTGKEIWFDNKANKNGKECLVKYNYENWNEYFYPINSDGSLDGDNVIIESRIYNRKN